MKHGANIKVSKTRIEWILIHFSIVHEKIQWIWKTFLTLVEINYTDFNIETDKSPLLNLL